MLKFRHGDILKSDAQTLVNTVNCRGVMGKGVALAFKRRYPQMFKDYVKRCKARELHPGEPYLFATDGRQIVNFPTKDDWRRNSRLEYVENGLSALRKSIASWHVRSLALPALGCGNGGLDWLDVKPLIQRYLGDLEIDVEVFEPFHHIVPVLSLPQNSAAVNQSAGQEEQPLPFAVVGAPTAPRPYPESAVEPLRLMVCSAGRVDDIEPIGGSKRNGVARVYLDDGTIIAVRRVDSDFITDLHHGDHLQVCFTPRLRRGPSRAVYHESLVVRVRDGKTLNAMGVPGTSAQIV